MQQVRVPVGIPSKRCRAFLALTPGQQFTAQSSRAWTTWLALQLLCCGYFLCPHVAAMQYFDLGLVFGCFITHHLNVTGCRGQIQVSQEQFVRFF